MLKEYALVSQKTINLEKIENSGIGITGFLTADFFDRS